MKRLLILFFLVMPLIAFASITSTADYYKLDGNSTDAAGSNNGTDTNVSYNASFGKINQGASFSGTGKIVASSISPLANDAAISFCAWANPQASGFNGVAFDIGGSPSGHDFGILFGYPVSNRIGYNVKSTWTDTGTAFSTNTWYHVCIVHAGTNTKVYINGSKVVDATSGSTDITGSLGIGAGGDGGNAFTGYVDEVGIFTQVLTQADIDTLYNGGAGTQYPFSVAASFDFSAFFPF